MAVHDFLQFPSLPCAEPGKEDDWFIPAKITDETVEDADGLSVEELTERRDDAILACKLDCPMAARLLCLDEGLQPGNTNHGIRGGYTEVQRRKIVREQGDRKRRLSTRAAAQAVLRYEEEREGLRPR